MNQFVKSLVPNIVNTFRGKNILWHLLAIVLTIIIVTTNFDWIYFTATRSSAITTIAFPAVILGTFLPLVIPLLYFLFGILRHNSFTLLKGWAIGQAAFLGWLISSFYKSFTGRIPPPLAFRVLSDNIQTTLTNTSHGFQFGFWRGGIFWGWPSSHTTVAFAMALCIVMIYPKNKKVAFLALLYALYVGLSVSVTIHWLSEFVAGAIIGSVIGVVVGKNFRKNLLSTNS